MGDNQIAQWEHRKDEQAEALAKLLSDRETLRDRIGRLGARNKQEVMASEVGRTLMEEYEQLARQIATQQQEVKISEVMIERAKSRLRSLEREALLRGTKVTDEEFRRMCGTDHVLEEELRRRAGEKTPGSEIQLDKLLDEVFAQGEMKMENTLYGHTVEILSVSGGESLGVPMALVDLRPNAERQLESRSETAIDYADVQQRTMRSVA